METTSLHQTPFAILGATTRDDRGQIVALADEKALELEPDACQKARSDLTNPRTRLAAETMWLPGVSPSRAKQLLDALLKNPTAIRAQRGIPTLAHLNLLASTFELMDSSEDTQELVDAILEFARLAELLSPEEVLRDVNEDRAISGFPEITALDLVEDHLVARRRYYRTAIKDALNRLPSMDLVGVMTAVVNAGISDGELQSARLVDDLVDAYEVEVQGFLQAEAENVQKIIESAKSTFGGGKDVTPYLSALERVVRNWCIIAKPVQCSTQVRGLVHDASRTLAYGIRSLAVDLCNEHDMPAESMRITALIQELFSEIPEVADKVAEDANALRDIQAQRSQAAARQGEWEQEISYSTDVGRLFKDRLSISSAGIVWKNRRYALESVTQVRWGSIRHSRNGVPTGTTFHIAFGDAGSVSKVELRKENVYSAFVDKLWRAVGVRLLTELLQALQAGREFSFGDAKVRDDGVTLVKHKFMAANELIRRPWSQVKIWIADGAFYIGDSEDKRAYVALSYINSPNTHVLEHAIRLAFKRLGLRRLSELLS